MQGTIYQVVEQAKRRRPAQAAGKKTRKLKALKKTRPKAKRSR